MAPTVVTPVKELAAAAGAIWRKQTGARLGIVGAEGRFLGGLSFYDPDHPVYFSNFSPDQSPWVTPERLRDEGMLVICPGRSDCSARLPLATAPLSKVVLFEALWVGSA